MVRNILFILGLLLFCAAPVFAQTAATLKDSNDQRFFCWENIDETETFAGRYWPGGWGQMWIGGTESTADLSLTYAPYIDQVREEIDTGIMSDGVRFNSSATDHMARFFAAKGYLGINFRSAGSAGQDLDVCISGIDLKAD